ncbi:TonB-dependent receptor [Aliiglaciecola sp. 2_MG-2023]|uniref:TonB-dependent receptor n=1 Tax=unclassified Aliiglaciecola TaxID=2593648 RepID=UPI0026E1829F|nr:MULTISPECIES: TonB-dependent receptor [unclassified Aliiglaciecola]MDO6712855.1 TonB-dependent receptor [Aliiglaciecola sp. 2_MG-2023]MDO6753950.1 TonB-dependent receptor [Aliiglaciecola sp. 1_MG-2023]
MKPTKSCLAISKNTFIQYAFGFLNALLLMLGFSFAIKSRYNNRQYRRYAPVNGLILSVFFCLPSAMAKNTQYLQTNTEKKQFIQIQNSSIEAAIKRISLVYQVPFVINGVGNNSENKVNIEGLYSLSAALEKMTRQSPWKYAITPHGIELSRAVKNLPNTAKSNIDEIIVTGLRASLDKAKQIKTHTVAVSDALASDDMANYPDINMAESLQRIPGVVITREAGEGRQVSLRGTSPDFTLVTINGMPVLANNDSPMDSRVQKQHDRSLDFNVFSSELFSQAQVLKSYSAEQITGGLAGTLALQTNRPFAQKGFQFVLAPQLGKNEYSDNTAPRITGLISNTWGNWGALLSASYGKRFVEERGANTIRWRAITPTVISLDALAPEVQQSFANNEVIMPRGNRYSLWRSEQQRRGLNLALEYQGEKSSARLDILHAALGATRNEFHLYPRGDQSTPIIPGITEFVDAQLNANNELVYSAFNNARVATESRAQDTKTTYKQAVFNSAFNLSEKWSLALLIGLEKSDFEIPTSNKIYTQGMSDISIDYRADRFFADIQYASDLTQRDLWEMREIDLEEYFATTRYQHGRIALKYQFTPNLLWQFGAEHTTFDTQTLSIYQTNLLLDAWSTTAQSLPMEYTQLVDSHPNVSWLGLQTHDAIQHFGIDPYSLTNNVALIEHFDDNLTEQKSSAFFTLKWQYKQFTVVAGSRFQQETTDVANEFSHHEHSNKHVNWLPSVNMVWRPSLSYAVRFSLSRNLASPSLSDLKGYAEYDPTDQVMYASNPDLKPYASTNIDVSLEWEARDHLSFSVTPFYKSIDDFIAPQARSLTLAETGLENKWQSNNLSDSSVITLVTNQNAESVSLLGFETMLRYEWSYLTSRWQHVGLIGHFNYTDGTKDYYNNDAEFLFQKALPYLSKKTAAVTLYYDDKILSGRISASYRDNYIHQVNPMTLQDEDETGFHSTLYIDASFSLQLNRRWQFSLEAQNLTNQREEQYSDSTDRAYNSTTSGRTFYVGLLYKY